jgi:hypothetical protein
MLPSLSLLNFARAHHYHRSTDAISLKDISVTMLTPNFIKIQQLV